jgi:predicted MFS family arabinose efflux permease
MPSSRDSSTALLSLRGFYFLTYAGMGALYPFLTLLLEGRGLRPRQIAWVMVVIPVGNLLVPPLWGVLADALRARLLLLRLACLGSGLCVLAFLPHWHLAGWIGAMALFVLFRSPLSALTDAATVDALGGRDASFSRIRLWGSAGFALAALGLGQLEPTSHDDLLMVTTAGIYLLGVLSTVALRAPPLGRQHGVAKQLGAALRQPRFVLFLLGNALHYLGHSTYDAYFGLHARRLGLGDDLIGAAWALGVAAEVVVLSAGPWLLGRASSSVLLCVASAGAVVRWLALSVTSSTVGLVALQSLHGLTFGLWFLSVVSFVQSRAPTELRTSLQSAAYSCLGLGTIGGYLGGGFVLERYGGSVLFELAAAAAGAGLLCYFATTLLSSPQRARTS